MGRTVSSNICIYVETELVQLRTGRQIFPRTCVKQWIRCQMETPLNDQDYLETPPESQYEIQMYHYIDLERPIKTEEPLHITEMDGK